MILSLGVCCFKIWKQNDLEVLLCLPQKVFLIVQCSMLPSSFKKDPPNITWFEIPPLCVLFPSWFQVPQIIVTWYVLHSINIVVNHFFKQHQKWLDTNSMFPPFMSCSQLSSNGAVPQWLPYWVASNIDWVTSCYALFMKQKMTLEKTWLNFGAS